MTDRAREAGPAASALRERSLTRLVLLWAAAIVTVTAIGTAGYILLVGWSLSDAAFMTVITLTTVGFSEVRELDDAGRIWTSLLSLAGVAIIFGTVGLVVETFLAEAVSGRRERRRMMEKIGQIENHLIVCGYGRVGSTVVRELEHSDQPVVIVDADPQSVAAARSEGRLVVAGDATDDDVLREAGVGRARALITTTDSDANNVYVTLSARALNDRLFIVARANQPGSEEKLRQAGADRVVSPYTRAGRHIAALATRPRVADFVDYALSHGQMSFVIEELEVEAGGAAVGETVGGLAERGIHVLAIAGGRGDYDINPRSDRELVAGDHLIVSGTADEVAAVAPAAGNAPGVEA